MTTKTATGNEKKQCGLCGLYVDEFRYRIHVNQCGLEEEKHDVKPAMKICALCQTPVTDLAQHYEKCTGGNSASSGVCTSRTNSPVPSYPQYSRTPVVEKKITKECPYCSRIIDANDYVDHLDVCATQSSRKSIKSQESKECPYCSRMIGANDYVDHLDVCPTQSTKPQESKECPYCSRMINANDYVDHLDVCPTQSTKPEEPKECPYCSRMIGANEYVDHLDVCPTQSTKPEDFKECLGCFQMIAIDGYRNHVGMCLNRSSQRSNHSSKLKPTTRISELSCFSCSSPVTRSESSGHTIPCRSNHIYCLACLQRSMNEHIQNTTAPICHSAFCDYELSRYDVACLPLKAESIQRLLPCVKSTKRPQCPLCLFYIDFNTMDDLEKHVGSCYSENLVPCECCSCLYNIHRLDSHLQQCRNTPSFERQQALIDYIVPRTKYPFTTEQIHAFLNYRKNKHLPIDPHSVVDALIQFGEVFPLEVRTFECVVCTGAFVYDDVFVIGCVDNHKLCYGCFEQSCNFQMNSKAILACPTCAFPLQQGEVEQLRITADRKKEFVKYQLQKLFDTYTDSTKGIIKCPNRGCKWVAEAENLNDRFQVKCRLCGYEFCSLCSQQYHFRTTCQQMPEVTQRWFFWCNTERGNYWQARAQQDANYRAQLEDHERQKAANVQRNQELQQRYNELLADETYKAQNCRLCPNCGRVVQHLSGCNSMICGVNYHGGDQQSGCGQRFDWGRATLYVPIANTGPEQVRNDLPAPEQQQHVVHTHVQCDACRNEIQGIRFDCVHCASVIFCEKCEQRATLQHSNQNRVDNKQQHVFQLIARP